MSKPMYSYYMMRNPIWQARKNYSLMSAMAITAVELCCYPRSVGPRPYRARKRLPSQARGIVDAWRYFSSSETSRFTSLSRGNGFPRANDPISDHFPEYREAPCTRRA